MLFALLSVIVTVHAYVFYSLYVVNGKTLTTIYETSSVLEAIRIQGGVYCFGRMLPIGGILLVEFLFALTLEIFLGQPLSMKIAMKLFDPKKTNPFLFETAVICSTVLLMCPSMSLIAAFLYYPYYEGFHFLKWLADWVKLVCLNFPFAFFSQIFFIQPLIRAIFKILFKPKKLKSLEEEREEMPAE